MSEPLPTKLTRESQLVIVMCGPHCFWPHCDSTKCKGEWIYLMAHRLTAENVIDPKWNPES